MGTPDISATCLKKILADGFEVVGVYTQPDRPKGRGMKLVASPVKELALAHNIPVFQPENFRADEDVQRLADLKPDVCAVVAYGRILPQRVLDIPTKGCINIHTSLLPQYRGSAPYQWAVLDGLKETGVSSIVKIDVPVVVGIPGSLEEGIVQTAALAVQRHQQDGIHKLFRIAFYKCISVFFEMEGTVQSLNDGIGQEPPLHEEAEQCILCIGCRINTGTERISCQCLPVC